MVHILNTTANFALLLIKKKIFSIRHMQMAGWFLIMNFKKTVKIKCLKDFFQSFRWWWCNSSPKSIPMHFSTSAYIWKHCFKNLLFSFLNGSFHRACILIIALRMARFFCWNAGKKTGIWWPPSLVWGRYKKWMTISREVVWIFSFGGVPLP